MNGLLVRIRNLDLTLIVNYDKGICFFAVLKLEKVMYTVF